MAKEKISWKLHFVELIVVIIGISIAFTLEGWSENSREQKLEVAYLKSLRADLISDKEEITSVADSAKRIVEIIGETFVLIYSNRDINEFKRHHITAAYTPPYFFSKNDTYISLVNSGNINYLKNFEIKSDLAELYEVEYDVLERTDMIIRNLVDRMIYPYMIEYIEFAGFRDGIENATPLRNNKVRNMLGSYSNFLGVRNTSYSQLIAACDSIIAKLDAELLQKD